MKKILMTIILALAVSFLFSCGTSSSYNFLKDSFWVVSQETYNGTTSDYPLILEGTDLRLFYEFNSDDTGVLYKYAANSEMSLDQRQAFPFSYEYKSNTLYITLQDGSEHIWEMNLDGLQLNMKGNAISFLLEKDGKQLYKSFLPQ